MWWFFYRLLICKRHGFEQFLWCAHSKSNGKRGKMKYVQLQKYIVFLFWLVVFCVWTYFGLAQSFCFYRFCRFLSLFFVYCYHGSIDCPIKYIIPNFNLFPITGVIITSIQWRENLKNAHWKCLVCSAHKKSAKQKLHCQHNVYERASLFIVQRRTVSY